MARVIPGRRRLMAVIAMRGVVIVGLSLLERLDLQWLHGRLGHCDHSRLKRGNDEHGDGQQGAN
jgi:hypothetical protein